jgi:hypothetical protein
LCHFVGDSTLESCRAFFRKLLPRIGNRPLYVSDEPFHCKTVLKEVYSTKEVIPKIGKRGRPGKAIRHIEPELDYAVVHKTRKNGRVVKVEQKIIFG